jgi:hypothetical protein
LAPYTSSASILEVEYSNAISNSPSTLNLSTNLHDLASGFMRRNHGKLCWELSAKHLEIRMTKACSMDFDKKIILAANRYRSLTKLVWFFKLHGINHRTVRSLFLKSITHLDDLSCSHQLSHLGDESRLFDDFRVKRVEQRRYYPTQLKAEKPVVDMLG